jgi:integrase/recombinase XerD
MKKGQKPSYVNDLLKAVKCLCHYAYNERYIDTLSTEKVRYTKEPKVLIHPFSEREIERMIHYYK